MYALMSDFKVLLLKLIAMHVSLILGPKVRGNHHVNKANLQWSLLMNVDLLQGTEQALMLHSVSIIIPCIYDVAVVYKFEG